MKAILVINKMPKSCYDCQYCRFDARRYNFRGCVLTDTDVQDGTIDICKELHSCCPLKPMPEKLPEVYCDSMWWGWNKILDRMIEEQTKLEDFAKGWNACLDAITGEPNESNISD